MNINDVKDTGPIPGDLIGALFVRQLELMEKYEPIEQRNGALLPKSIGIRQVTINSAVHKFPTFAVDSTATQARIKDFFWRATEELAEAFEEVDDEMADVIYFGMDDAEKNPSVMHCFEELVDCMHFMVEASIIAGLSHQVVNDVLEKAYAVEVHDSASGITWAVIRDLGLAANTLKNKLWKQSQMQTDLTRFYFHFGQAWFEFFRLVNSFGLKRLDLYRLYFKKSEVNKFRQRSNY